MAGAMKVLITGAGTLAQALLAHMIGPMTPVLYFRSEYQAVRLGWDDSEVPIVLGDIRNELRLRAALYEHEIDYVIHTAALKQVGSGSANVLECAAVNVDGTANVVRACQAVSAKMLFTSSDKAVAPLNTYGKAKALAEDIVLSAGFSVTRWGNVIRSRGSVLERWERSRRIAITWPGWTRYWLTRDAAAAFVFKAIEKPPGVHVKPSKAMRLGALATAASMAYGVPVEQDRVASAPGDKGHEMLGYEHGSSQDAEQYTEQDMADIILEDMRRWPLI